MAYSEEAAQRKRVYRADGQRKVWTTFGTVSGEDDTDGLPVEGQILKNRDGTPMTTAFRACMPRYTPTLVIIDWVSVQPATIM